MADPLPGLGLGRRDGGRLLDVRGCLIEYQEAVVVFDDLATPLSAVSLHLERAARLSDRGEDPADALRTAREQLDRAFSMLERGREELLG